MRQETRTIYTLAELREQLPDAYKRVHERWKEQCAADPDVPWMGEVMDSLKACVKACGARLVDWSIGPYVHSSIDVECEDYADDGETRKDAAWLYAYVLTPLGYKRKGDTVDFPGECPWSGYCADEDFIEAVYKAMEAGESLSDALEGLADVARKLMESDCEQMQEEESMEANWGDNEYTEDGEEA